eukprot:4015297-Pleurochrysis_carterae.AAC.2
MTKSATLSRLFEAHVTQCVETFASKKLPVAYRVSRAQLRRGDETARPAQGESQLRAARHARPD